MSQEHEERSLRDKIVSNRIVILLGAIALAAIAAACVLAIMLLRPSDDEGVDGDVAEVLTPTPFPTVEAPVSRPVGGESLVMGLSDTGTISVTMDVPESLNLAGNRFLVRSDVIPAGGTWVPTFADDNTAAWVYGSIVNFVFGLPDSDANRATLGELLPGDEIRLTTRSGIEYSFRFNSRELSSAANQDVFAQKEPGITIILLGGEDEERLVVNGHYVVPDTSSADQRPVVQLGETAQLDDIQITVTGASHLLDRPEAPPGFAFYLIDYQIQNVGLSALDTSILQHLLLDDLGNQYALSPAAVRLGNHPAVPGILNSNQTVEASAGYQIPISLDSSTMNWVVSRTDTQGQVQVTIPFGSDRDLAEQQTNVILQRAEVSTDLTNLILGGQVTNLGAQTVLVSESDVMLRTGDGSVYLLLSTNPPFPWTVGASQTVQFLVTFQRPLGADTAIFTVLNQPYELSGLR